MAGDALTTAQAAARGVDAQCPLAAVRNLRRNPTYSVERPAERGAIRNYPLDVKFPDWPRIMQPMLEGDEVVKRFAVSGVSMSELMDVRAGVIVQAIHVVCFHNAEDGTYRLYDNDSAERRRGTFETLRADELITRYRNGYIVCVLPDGSDLSTRLGPAITTMITENTRARRRAGGQNAAQPVQRRQGSLTGWLTLSG